MRHCGLSVFAGHHGLRHNQSINIKQTEEKVNGTERGHQDRIGMYHVVAR